MQEGIQRDIEGHIGLLAYWEHREMVRTWGNIGDTGEDRGHLGGYIGNIA